jgi:hypothetical protein
VLSEGFETVLLLVSSISDPVGPLAHARAASHAAAISEPDLDNGQPDPPGPGYAAHPASPDGARRVWSEATTER